MKTSFFIRIAIFMKYLFFTIGFFLLYSCSILQSEPSYTKRHPGNHSVTNNKKVAKDNMKYYKEHQKAALKKREELETYLQSNGVSTSKSKKKRD